MANIAKEFHVEIFMHSIVKMMSLKCNKEDWQRAVADR